MGNLIEQWRKIASLYLQRSLETAINYWLISHNYQAQRGFRNAMLRLSMQVCVVLLFGDIKGIKGRYQKWEKISVSTWILQFLSKHYKSTFLFLSKTLIAFSNILILSLFQVSLQFLLTDKSANEWWVNYPSFLITE